MTFVYSLLTLVLLFNTIHASAARMPSCAGALSGLQIPAGWGIAPDEFAAVARDLEPLAPTLLQYAKFLRFMTEPHNSEFLEILGHYANFGYAKDFLRGQGHGELENLGALNHRLIILEQLQQSAVTEGLLKDPLGAFAQIILADALGELSYASPGTLDDFKRELREDVKEFVVAHRGELPKLRAVLTQSVAAQMALSDLMIAGSSSPFAIRLARIAPLLGDRLREVAGQETAPEKLVLDEIEDMLRGKYPERFLPRNFDTHVSRKVRRDYVQKLDEDLLGFVLHGVLRSMLDSILAHLEREQDFAVIQNPIFMLAELDRALSAQTMVDQGLNSFLRQAFISVVFKKQALDAEAVTAAVRQQVIPHLKRVRTFWRAYQLVEKDFASARRLSPPTEVAPLSEGLTREERKRRHAAKAAIEIAREFNPALLAASDVRPPEIAKDSGIWDQITDRDLDLVSARKLFRQTILPDTPVEVTGLRTGFTYRFELSDKLVRKLAKPESGHPADVRAWLEAFRLGRARPKVESGLVRLRHPQGIYTFALTLNSSDYCLLGYRTRDRVLRFESIDLLH